jgi:hypothetical protein
MLNKCAATGCEKQIPSTILMCWPHWRRVPKRIQRDIWDTCKRMVNGDEDAEAPYMFARDEAIAAVAAKESR